VHPEKLLDSTPVFAPAGGGWQADFVSGVWPMRSYHHHQISPENHQKHDTNPGWWFGTMEFYGCPFSWECHHPN